LISKECQLGYFSGKNRLFLYWLLFFNDIIVLKMKIIIRYLIILVPVVYIASCTKIAVQSPIPSIKFKSFEVFDTTDILGNRTKGGRLKFSFEDGDGDLGLQAPENGQTDSTNLFLTLFRKKGEDLIQAATNDPLFPSAYRIPYMERQGVNKMLKGTISVTFLYLFYSGSDTIKYDFYIVDRLNNESNTASTNEIFLNKNGVY
jgi:hypothetical protein